MEWITADNNRDLTLSMYFVSDERFLYTSVPVFRLVFIKEGSGILRINEKSVVFAAPLLICLKAFDKLELKEAFNLRAESIYFDPVVVNDALKIDCINREENFSSLADFQDYFLLTPFLTHSEDNNGEFSLGHGLAKRVTDIFSSLARELQMLDNDYWRCRSRAYLFEVLFVVQNIYTSNNKKEIDLPKATTELSGIILYLQTNYYRKVTIEELTENFHINRTSLSKKFFEAMGMTIIEYLTKYRIQMAITMLRETELPVSEIAYRVGFKDNTHFGRMFKKFVGYTPSYYRK